MATKFGDWLAKPRVLCLGAACAASVLYARWVRPRLLTWGATPDEVSGRYPGDELIPDPAHSSTIATTLPAPPERVWPWLAQMGYDRAGWYSWDKLDHGGKPSADRIVPGWQNLHEGQRLNSMAGGRNWMTVSVLEPNRTLVLRSVYQPPSFRAIDPRSASLPAARMDAIWGFHLRSVPGGRTRLLIRKRGRGPRAAAWPVSLLYDPLHVIMQTRQFRNLRTRLGPQERLDRSERGGGGRWSGARLLKIRDVSLFVEVRGQGYPLVVMHGGPSADHYSMLPFWELAHRYTVIMYDHRCNGRSAGAPVSSMTWENLTADADALRQELGFERWAVLGHSFGGHVALEYALRYPASLSHLVLLNTGGDAHWEQQNAADLLARRGYGAKKAELVRRWFNGELTPREYFPMFIRIGDVYHIHYGPWLARDLIHGAWRSKIRPEALIFAGRDLLKDWTVMDRLGEVTVPTLVVAGRDDGVFPPDCQRELAAGIPHARLQLVDHAGHSPHAEQTAAVMAEIGRFISAEVAPA